MESANEMLAAQCKESSLVQLYIKLQMRKKCDLCYCHHGMVAGTRWSVWTVSEMADLLGFPHTNSEQSLHKTVCLKKKKKASCEFMISGLWGIARRLGADW